MIRFPSARDLVAIAAMAVVGCSAEVTVETQPNPAISGQPVTVTVTVDNPLDCPLTGAEATLYVVAEGSATAVSGAAVTSGIITEEGELEFLCDALNDPTLLICALFTDPEVPGELPSDVPGMCCGDAEFADANPDLCRMATTPTDGRLREVIIEQARKLGLPVDEILGAGSGQAATSGSTIECTVLTESEGGVFFECLLGDIPANGSVTATATFSPSLPGRYFSFAFVDGDAECADNDGGTGCGRFLVGASAMAPAASPTGLALLAFALIGIGGWAIHARRTAI